MSFNEDMKIAAMEREKPRLGISACLLGHRVRYDGGHKRDSFLTDIFGRYIEWVTVCPELEAGMGVPRETVRLVGPAASPRMVAEKSGKDWTPALTRFAAKRVSELARLDLSGYVFKKDSPSCGLERVRIYNAHNLPARNGRGLFAAAVTENLPLLPVEEEGRLHDPALRENFIERVFAYHRWQKQLAGRKSIATLVYFHTVHKFLLLAHSERHYRRLGKIVAAAKQTPIRDAHDEYGRFFMAGLAVHATAKKHANVLDHMMGYFSQKLSPEERAELVQLIKDFRHQLIPLVVPITLVRHYVSKYGVEYLANQAYLDPSPRELMLRNHV
jgi:uncharacterized protein YbgA (DUF1722 family)/uncharacterized protein YbbK (DUF523 family)